MTGNSREKEHFVLSLLIEASIIHPTKENMEEIIIFMISQDISLSELEELCLKEVSGKELFVKLESVYSRVSNGIKE